MVPRDLWEEAGKSAKSVECRSDQLRTVPKIPKIPLTHRALFRAQRRRGASAIRARPSAVLGPVLRPP
jgi:hypothetical protein